MLRALRGMSNVVGVVVYLVFWSWPEKGNRKNTHEQEQEKEREREREKKSERESEGH